MPKFAYVAVSPDGTSARGVQVAPSLQDARAAITGGDLRIVDIAAKRRLLEIEVAPARIRPSELMHLSRQLGAFLRAGIPILDAISVLAAESDRTAVRRALTAMGEDLRPDSGSRTPSTAIPATSRPGTGASCARRS